MLRAIILPTLLMLLMLLYAALPATSRLSTSACRDSTRRGHDVLMRTIFRDILLRFFYSFVKGGGHKHSVQIIPRTLVAVDMHQE